jgi:hypothetical protein
MHSIIHLCSELYIHFIQLELCIYMWSCEPVLRSCFPPHLTRLCALGFNVSCDLSERSQNSEPHLLVCVFAGQWCVPRAQIGLPHWQHACRLPLGSDGVIPCNPELQLLSSRPCCSSGHNFDLLFLWPAMSLGCYSRLTPTSWFWQGLWQCCCWAGHVLLCLMIGRRLGLHPVSTTLPPRLPPPHRNYPVSSSGSPLAFLHALSIGSQRFRAPPLCVVFCNPKNQFWYVFLFMIIFLHENLICGFLFIKYTPDTWWFNWTSIRPPVLFLSSVADSCVW